MQLPANFCSNCGKPLRTIPLPTSVPRQIVVYMASFFLAPFGLWFAWKYLRQDDQKSKMIGCIAIAFTIAALAITVWTIAGLFNSFNQLAKTLSGL
jgi:hypothetical protein